ncbi:MAG: hypothetical protein R3E01_32220 [Pirellulaceae bacterium]|nr:hypothetical protein [Planctomycetales bacterium]
MSTFQDGDGAVAGEHQVIVVQIVPMEMLSNRLASGIKDTEAHASHQVLNLVAPRFSQYASTPLSIHISADDQNSPELVVEPLPSRTQKRIPSPAKR